MLTMKTAIGSFRMSSAYTHCQVCTATQMCHLLCWQVEEDDGEACESQAAEDADESDMQ